jgi:hypothetical protein
MTLFSLLYRLMANKNPQVCDNTYAGTGHPVATTTGAPAI